MEGEVGREEGVGGPLLTFVPPSSGSDPPLGFFPQGRKGWGWGGVGGSLAPVVK